MHGQEIGTYAYGLWPVVAFNIVLFLFFALTFVRPKGLVEWRSMGAFIAFIVALFTEMYGIPLTIYFLSHWLGNAYPVLNPFTHAYGHLWLVMLGHAHSTAAMTFLHFVSNGISILGFFLLYKGWSLIRGSEGNLLVTDGIYARMRHPQYADLFLITLGLLVQWPTFISLIMWPILIFAYWRLARKEEAEVSAQFPREYARYHEQVPAFIPRFNRDPIRTAQT